MTLETRSVLFFLASAIVAVVLALATYLVIFVAPVEEVMGLAQKIFYLHVPSAMAMYAGVTLCSVASLVFLLRRSRAWDAAARAGADLATVFCVIVLVTGPLWAARVWGAPWIWDPRLTGVAVLGLILAAYHLVGIVGQEVQATRRLAAALGVLAAPNGVLIHVAVQMWGGLHPTVIYDRGGLDPTMRSIFFVCIVAVLGLFSLLAWWRIDLALLRLRLDALEVRSLILRGGER